MGIFNISNKKDSKKTGTHSKIPDCRTREAILKKQVENNLTGKELEIAGRVDEAVKLYEENVATRFDGSFPYNRLAIIYRERKDYDNEIRVLKRAVDVFQGIDSQRIDTNPKLQKFRERLEKAKELKRKSKKF